VIEITKARSQKIVKSKKLRDKRGGDVMKFSLQCNEAHWSFPFFLTRADRDHASYMQNSKAEVEASNMI